MRDRTKRAKYEQLAKKLKYSEGGNVCGICGGLIDLNLKAPHPYSWSCDHIIPVSKWAEGYADPQNLQPAHRCCNRAKYDKIKIPKNIKSRDWKNL